MMKQWKYGLVLFFISSIASADFYVDPNITGYDLAGVKVKACFDDGGNTAGGLCQSQEWSATSVINQSGEATKNDWFSVSLTGTSFFDYDSDNDKYYGLWTLDNLHSDYSLTSLLIEAWTADFYFDNKAYIEVTPGSGSGYPFFAANKDLDQNGHLVEFTGVTGVNSQQLDPAYNDLFGNLNITFDNGLAAGEGILFTSDVDYAKVPEPSSLGIFSLALLSIFGIRKRFLGK
jgi:hypothetical protein